MGGADIGDGDISPLLGELDAGGQVLNYTDVKQTAVKDLKSVFPASSPSLGHSSLSNISRTSTIALSTVLRTTSLS
jgi:hypothetical protein